MGLRVIFLDIDGVLNCATTAARLPSGVIGFDPAKVAMLNAVVDATGAKIVLSSSLRKQDDWREMLLENGVRGAIDRTPSLGFYRYEDRPRGREIAAWLEGHPEVERYAIIDDSDDMLPDQPLFRTAWTTGLTQDVADAVIAHFAAS